MAPVTMRTQIWNNGGGTQSAAIAALITPHDWKRDDQATQYLLELGSDRLVMLSVIAKWSDDQCREAEVFASAAHFRASDNAVRVPPMPEHLAACPRRAIGVEDADLSHL